MNTQRRPTNKQVKITTVLAAGLLVAGLAAQLGTASAQGAGFADPAFQRVWERTDKPVADGRVSRTWMWGPQPGRSLQEPFKEGPNGQHLVQYFDKARMEINNPSASPSDPYYVTNGLLVVEMISGRIQTGVNDFQSVGGNDAQIAGDPGSDAPSYDALSKVAGVGVAPEHRASPLAPGAAFAPVFISRDGSTSTISPGLLPANSTIKSAGFVNETGHNIADVFWTYLNSQGPVLQNGVYANGPLMNWVSATGFPVTEPYWTRIKVGGNDRMVLFQAFQRRVLTYSPDNAPGWKVEMGNVGAQYYTWRYENPGLTCLRVPVRGFGRVWADHRNVQQSLGCPQQYPPFDKEIAVQTAYQPFEHGTMLWISRTTYVQEKLIYVFFDDGNFQQFDDTWKEGQPVSGGLTPPQGLYEPQRGFGKVWREGTGARVRERLGWATAPEKGGDGAYQRFNTGEMYWTAAADKIFVLYGTVNGPQYPAPTPSTGQSGYRYEVYNDTFNP